MQPIGGVHPRSAPETLGHSNAGMTLDRLNHVLTPVQAQAVASLQEKLGG
jgi:hypothetical protein